MLENRCDCKPQDVELVNKVKDNMPAFDEIMVKMKSKVSSFSFLMELIIVILFFAASATICASFIVEAKNKQMEATEIQDSLLAASNLIESLQAKNQDLSYLLNNYQQVDTLTYQNDNLVIEFSDLNYTGGKVIIVINNEVISELPFILGGN